MLYGCHIHGSIIILSLSFIRRKTRIEWRNGSPNAFPERSLCDIPRMCRDVPVADVGWDVNVG